MKRLAAGWLPALLAGSFFLAAPAVAPLAAQQVPTPAQVFGFEPGTDYELADYDQLLDFYHQLAEASPRVELREIGRTTRGEPMIVLFISSEANLAQLERWRSISERLGRARGLTDEEARRLAREGRAIVWIDSGLHSTERAHSQHAPVLAYHVATDESEETRRIRDDVVLLLMPVMNPDGHRIVVDWYREQLGTPFETTEPPEIYNEFVGHDNNRDWFMILQEETRAVAQVLYDEWYPQIVFNHHQTAPFPARIFIPPFADPVNPNIPPLVVRSVNLVGDHMAKRFEAEGKSGVVSRMTFDMWWNGGMRTAPYFHNMVGILSEVGHSSPTPMYHEPDELPLRFGTGSDNISAREPSIFYANPWPGGWARIGDAVQYHLTASLATLDIASRLREDWLYNFYQMGRDAIRAGEAGSPFAYVVPLEGQWDEAETVEMLNVLRRGGVEVHRSTRDFQAGGQRFPAGTYIVYAGQAFRAHVLDLMEPQVYPDRRLYEGGPPQPPYDLAGWTLPIQMGVDVVRVDEPFEARTEAVERAEPRPGRIAGGASAGYLLSPRSNKSAVAVNRLLAAGEAVSWAADAFELGGARHDAGTFLIESREGTRARVDALAAELGLDFRGADRRPPVRMEQLRQPRIGVYRSWLANIPEGWFRWILDQYEFPLENLYDQDVRTRDLSGYDVIVLPAQAPAGILTGHAPGTMPARYVGGLGVEGAAALKRFVEGGGTLVAFDGATDVVIQQFGLPVRNVVAGLPQDRFFIPGSLLRVRVNRDHPLAYGMPEDAAASFVTRRGSQSRAFEIVRPAAVEDRVAGAQPVDVVVRWAEDDLLLSGWALGEQRHLAGKPAMVRVRQGDGDVVLIGFRAEFRGQPRGTFKLFFNALRGSTLGDLPLLIAEEAPE